MPILIAVSWSGGLAVSRLLGLAQKPEWPARPRNHETSQPRSRLSPFVRRDDVLDLRRLLGHERFAVLDADQRAEMAAARFDHLQKLLVGNERRRFLRLRIVELRLEGGDGA